MATLGIKKKVKKGKKLLSYMSEVQKADMLRGANRPFGLVLAENRALTLVFLVQN